MGIQALPSGTVRALGATQVLTDPSALVKELLDNALDAHATSVSIEIHSNTIDVIQVRDNGDGIAPDDRALVARRYCTSKISHDDDLKDIGGSSLGFRGEALASAAELSGSLTISTRIEGEQVAASLKINQLGEVAGQDPASLPAGTTVRVTDFIKANPVRKQVVLKNAEACLKKIKRTVQAYAFARPHVRLSLRVLKSKNMKGDWVYASKPGGNAEDAAFKIVGAACASQCTWSIVEENGFALQAFLPRPDADPNKIGNVGSFLSVDARPVNAARGTFKQVVKSFREALKKESSRFEDVKDPFLFLDISCPRGSYDANLEPAKDDVLFEDANLVVDAAKKLFAAVYTSNEAHKKEDHALVADMSKLEEAVFEVDDFTTSLELPIQEESISAGRVRAANQHQTIHEEQTKSGQPFGRSSTSDDIPEDPRAFRSNMYGCDEEDLELPDGRPSTGRTAAEMEELRAARKDVTVSNPWVLAKLNSTVQRTPIEQHIDDPAEPVPGMFGSPQKRPGRPARVEEASLPTPRPSSPSPIPMNQGFHSLEHVSAWQLAGNVQASSNEDLPVQQLYTPFASGDTPGVGTGFTSNNQRPAPPEYSYTLNAQAPVAPMGTPLGAIPEVTRPRRSPAKQPRQSNINKPFVPPLKDHAQREKVWFDHLENIERPRRQGRNKQANNHGGGSVMLGELGDFAEEAHPLTPPRRNRDIRDFIGKGKTEAVASMIEGRNYWRGVEEGHAQDRENRPEREDIAMSIPAGAVAARGFMPVREMEILEAHVPSPGKQSPYQSKRRRISERRPLRELSRNTSITFGGPEDEEYRPQTSDRPLSRRRSSNKPGRTKSSKLPLERVPAGQGVHNIVSNFVTSAQQISIAAGKIDEEASLLGYDEPAHEPGSIFTDVLVDLHELTNSLHDLLIKVGSDEEPPTPDRLFQQMRAAFEQHTPTTEGDVDEVMSTA